MIRSTLTDVFRSENCWPIEHTFVEGDIGCVTAKADMNVPRSVALSI